ncbi:MAG: prolyl oligopeptidase family serine peptidase [candidate division WOR-3 bacterium]|nr:prolyl oligopeptidase family serine peptidase [candidate division WOR-3 bacterium]MDH5684570.1 prolyl oligopeptidase family serine peptidase [candidate division WOR-3 bacterium]
MKTDNVQIIVTLLIFVTLTGSLAENIFCDADSDCFYIPQKVKKSETGSPALIYLSCTGATAKDLDSIKIVGDSLKWILASCHKSRNHRYSMLNDKDIIKTYQKLLRNYRVDTSRIFIYGFSGMGVQALMELFLHPEKFSGAIAVCAHSQAMALAQWENLNENLVYLVSRTKDWNLSENLLIHQKFQQSRVRDTLVITPGEHSIGDKIELLNACSWLNRNSQPNIENKKP